MHHRPARTDSTTPNEIREHYEIEKELANRLRRSTKEDRRFLYRFLYDELFKRVPRHPQLIQKADSEASARAVVRQMQLVGRFLGPESTFLEVGSGDCKLALEVARRVRKVYAIDVSSEITRDLTLPPNFELMISDGTSLPVPENSITVAYSNQLMEHLHPDDAFEQLHNIYNALAHGGIYICVTPNRISGPHDVSQYFDDVATGFHMKEYTFGDLELLFSGAGFSKVGAYAGGKGIYVRSPLFPIEMCESLLGALPSPLRRRLTRMPPIRALLGMIIVGRK